MPTLTFHSSACCPSVELIINEKKHLFLVDTGANTTVLTPELAKTLKFHQNVETHSFNGVTITSIYTGKFNIFGKTLTQIMVAELSQVGRHISGILGQDLFRQFKQLEIDYVCMVIRFKE